MGTAFTNSRTPAQVTIRPNHLRDANLPADERSTARWFDTAAFGPPTPGSLGTAAKGTIKGPGTEIVNIGIAKYFSIGERLRIRWELTATNFFNSPNYEVPNTTINSAGSAGTITAVGGGAGLDSTGPRSFRMGLRVEW